jgi:hypothetical protein
VATGKNGPVFIPLAKSGDTYAVPAGAKLTDAQFASFQAGTLYVNVHTAANPDGNARTTEALTSVFAPSNPAGVTVIRWPVP